MSANCAKSKFKVTKDECGNIIIEHCGTCKSYRLIEFNTAKNYIVVQGESGEKIKLTNENVIGPFDIQTFKECFCVAQPVTLENAEITTQKFSQVPLEMCDKITKKECTVLRCVNDGVVTYLEHPYNEAATPMDQETFDSKYEKCETKEWICQIVIKDYDIENDPLTYQEMIDMSSGVIFPDGSVGGDIEGINFVKFAVVDKKGQTDLGELTINGNVTEWTENSSANIELEPGQSIPTDFQFNVIKGCIRISYGVYKCK